MTSLCIELALDRGDFKLEVAHNSSSAVTGLFGDSGAGKSTLIDVIAGLQRADRGRISFGDEVLFDSANSINVPAHRRRVGVVFQAHRLFPHLTVTENLKYGWRLLRDDNRRFSFDAIVDLLELARLLGRRIDQLSGGERQRIALGRALLSSPRLLLLDEPLVSMDRRLRQQIIPFLIRVRDELQTPMVMASHELAEILQLTQDLLVLRNGQVAAAGAYRSLVADDENAAIFDDADIVNVLEFRIDAQHPGDGNTVLAFDGAPGEAKRVIGPFIRGEPGRTLVATLSPSDIALAAGPVPAVSIQNQIEGTVTNATNRANHVLVEVDIGKPILARISLKSLNALGLTQGDRVTCLFKSNAIRYRVT